MKIQKLISSCFSCEHYSCEKNHNNSFDCFCTKQDREIPNPDQFPDWCPLEDCPNKSMGVS